MGKIFSFSFRFVRVSKRFSGFNSNRPRCVSSFWKQRRLENMITSVVANCVPQSLRIASWTFCSARDWLYQCIRMYSLLGQPEIGCLSLADWLAQLVLCTPRIYHFLAEPITICTIAKVFSFVKLLYMEVQWSKCFHHFLAEPKIIRRTAKVCSLWSCLWNCQGTQLKIAVKAAQVWQLHGHFRTAIYGPIPQVRE